MKIIWKIYLEKDKGNIFPPFLFLTFGPVGLFSPLARSLLSSSPSSRSWAGPARAKTLPPRQPAPSLNRCRLFSRWPACQLFPPPPESRGTIAAQPPPRSWRRGRVAPLPGFFKRKPRPSRSPCCSSPLQFRARLCTRKP